jgi:hypothetical protein
MAGLIIKVIGSGLCGGSLLQCNMEKALDEENMLKANLN